MKILVVCQYFSPEPFRVLDFCQGLQRLGHEVSVLTGMPNYPSGSFFAGYGVRGPYYENMAGVKVYRAPIIPRGKTKLQLALNYLTFFLTGSMRSFSLTWQSFDLVFVYQLSPITMAIPGYVVTKLKRIPLLIYTLDIWPDSIAATGVRLPAVLYKLVESMSKQLYRRADKVLISSRGFASRLAVMGVGAGKIHYWPQSIDRNTANECEIMANKKRNRLPQGFLVFFAGNVGVAQSMETLVAAAEELKQDRDIHWVVLGDGRMSGWLAQEVERRGLTTQVHLLGRFPAQEMPAWFAVADALLVMLKKDPLLSITLPAKVQSYLQSGRPILAVMDGEGAAVVKEAAAGLVCPAEDVQGLVRNVKVLHSMSKEKRDEFGQNGLRYAARHFDNVKLMQELDQLIRQEMKDEGK